MPADGLTLFWFRPKTSNVFDGDLWTALRSTKDDAFSNVHPLGDSINTDASEQHPFLSANGLTLFFDRGTPDPRLWQSDRTSASTEFTDATLLPLPESWHQRNAYAPSLSSDGKLLIFTSNEVPGKEGFETGVLWMTKQIESSSAPVAIETTPAQRATVTHE